MSTSTMTVTEVTESLTGFDEIAVTKHMEIDPYRDAEAKPVLMLRALVFVDQRRSGLKDPEARHVAMSMPLSALQEYFADDPEEVDDDEPETPEGNDDSAGGSERTGWPSSASAPESNPPSTSI